MANKYLIPVSKPIISESDIRAVVKVLRSGNLAQGHVVEDFEKEFARFIGAKYAVAVGNGTQALHLALTSLGISDGDEVITTPFSFIASANCILYNNATPIFADVLPETFCIDPKAVESLITKKTKAILPVHLYGQMCDMTPLLALAKKYNLKIIEDACQAHGSTYKGHFAGTLGDLGCFSFYPTKNMTTGEGGIITTNNVSLYKSLLLLRNHGQEVRYYHEILGYNFRMTNINAALGISQLKHLPKWNKKRKSNAAYLTKHLSGIRGLQCPKVAPNCEHVFHQYTLQIDKDFGCSRDALAKILLERGIATGVYYPVLIPDQVSLKNITKKVECPVARKLTAQVLSIPVNPLLSKKDLEYIVNTIKEVSNGKSK